MNPPPPLSSPPLPPQATKAGTQTSPQQQQQQQHPPPPPNQLVRRGSQSALQMRIPVTIGQEKTVFTAGRPPWYSKEGKIVKDTFVIGCAGGSASGKTTVAEYHYFTLPCIISFFPFGGLFPFLEVFFLLQVWSGFNFGKSHDSSSVGNGGSVDAGLIRMKDLLSPPPPLLFTGLENPGRHSCLRTPLEDH